MIEQDKLLQPDDDQVEEKNHIKDAIFQTYHSIHSINQTSFLLSFILITTSFFSIFSYLINDELGVIDSQTTNMYCFYFFRVIRFSYNLKQDFSTLTFSVYICFGIQFLLLLLFIFLLCHAIF